MTRTAGCNITHKYIDCKDALWMKKSKGETRKMFMLIIKDRRTKGTLKRFIVKH